MIGTESKGSKPIPKFESEDAERKFWSEADSADYVDWSSAKRTRFRELGCIFAGLELSNPREPDLDVIEVKALVETGALMLCIPDHVARQLKLEEETLREVTLAQRAQRERPLRGTHQGRLR